MRKYSAYLEQAIIFNAATSYHPDTPNTLLSMMSFQYCYQQLNGVHCKKRPLHHKVHQHVKHMLSLRANESDQTPPVLDDLKQQLAARFSAMQAQLQQYDTASINPLLITTDRAHYRAEPAHLQSAKTYYSRTVMPLAVATSLLLSGLLTPATLPIKLVVAVPALVLAGFQRQITNLLNFDRFAGPRQIEAKAFDPDLAPSWSNAFHLNTPADILLINMLSQYCEAVETLNRTGNVQCGINLLALAPPDAFYALTHMCQFIDLESNTFDAKKLLAHEMQLKSNLESRMTSFHLPAIQETAIERRHVPIHQDREPE